MSEELLYDLSQLREVAAGSEEFVDKMVEMFVSMTPGLVERIQNGVLSSDWEEVRSAAHKMKPSIDMMGIESLKLVVREIEGNAKTATNLDDIPALLGHMMETLDLVYRQLNNR